MPERPSERRGRGERRRARSDPSAHSRRTGNEVASLTAPLMQIRLFQTGSVALPASREPHSVAFCEHLHQNLFWACISRIHAQVPLVTSGKLTEAFHQQIPCSNGRQRFGEFQHPEFRQRQNATLPGRPSILKAQAPRAAFALELRILGTAGKEVAKRDVLIAQALGEAGRGYYLKPLVALSSFPLRQPTRNVIAGEVKTALPVRLGADLERGVPQPPVRAEPAVPQTALSPVRIAANPIASRDGPHGLF